MLDGFLFSSSVETPQLRFRRIEHGFSVLNDLLNSLIKKAARKIYLVVQLKRARVPAEDLDVYYCACIRSSLNFDYACPVFHYSLRLPQYLQSELESVQKRALPCIFPGMPYREVLERACLTSIRDHHEDITKSLFRSTQRES